MRIRKRAVPLPLSLLSPVPFSDLHHHHLVQLSTSHPSDLRHHDHGLRRLIRHDRPTAAASTTQPHPPQPIKAYEDEKTNIEQREERSNTSKQSDSGAVADNRAHELVSLIPLSPTNQTRVEGRWCDGDKAIPLKKRKASFEMNGMVVTGECKIKSKTNKKCPLEEDPEKDHNNDNDDDDYEDGNSESDINSKKKKRKSKKSSIAINAGGANMKSSIKKKKKKKGGGLMEGSRCSRINGRGWRCMQPTLVGYSLCEHHLGKGRLRSMSSVRARSAKITTTTTTLLSQLPPDDVEKSCNPHEKPVQDDDTMTMMMIHGDDDHEEKPISVGAGNGRKRRIGMVKARSLSSLLCLPNTTTTSIVQIGASSANQAS